MTDHIGSGIYTTLRTVRLCEAAGEAGPERQGTQDIVYNASFRRDLAFELAYT